MAIEPLWGKFLTNVNMKIETLSKWNNYPVNHLLFQSRNRRSNWPSPIVADPPEVRVDARFVHAAPGDGAQLECIVQGNPEPTVSEFEEKMFRGMLTP